MEEEKTIRRNVDSHLAFFFLIAFALLVTVYLVVEVSMKDVDIPALVNTPISIERQDFFEDRRAAVFFENINRFGSEEDFKDFLSESQNYDSAYPLGLETGIAMENTETVFSKDTAYVPQALSEKSDEGSSASRFSETNVQVKGIDEPDIVKTDGKKIYFSQQYSYYWQKSRMMPEGEGLDTPKSGETKIINAFPPQTLAADSQIEKSGEIILDRNNLVIFSSNGIFGYNVSEPKEPEEAWNIKFEDNNTLAGTRLYDGSLYVVTKDSINKYAPCPIKPLYTNNNPFIVKCDEIYYPETRLSADVIYNAFVINPLNGKILRSVSFVASSTGSLVYMSKDAIYITWSQYGDYPRFLYNFLSEKCKGLISDSISSRIGKVISYQLSDRTKIMEISSILQDYQQSLSEDEKMRIQNEISNRMQNSLDEFKRDLSRTGIVKIQTSDLSIVASSSIPGRTLNQFSFDEYGENLRIATTVGQNLWIGNASSINANDIYVLDSNLGIIGSIRDLGLTERIYSVRFVENRGYIVTFRETDPFYVIDLSNPRKPVMKGELKIPGYSAYLHPISKDKILGIGKEDWKVKISLFDVSLASEPKEIAKYALDEYWTEVENNHHAFLIDPEKELFFLPGGKGGYVFSYQADSLELKKAISQTGTKRAIYLNDYLYIIGEDRISVISEDNFEKINEMLF